jgi:hypothetical protein
MLLKRGVILTQKDIDAVKRILLIDPSDREIVVLIKRDQEEAGTGRG